MLEAEEPTDEDQVDTDVRFSFFLSLFRPESETVEADVAVFYQPRVDDLADARAFIAARLQVDVVGGLYLLVRCGLQYDSRHPAGVENRD